MQPPVKIFWCAKHGNAAEEYEDAAAFSTARLAIADGATESSFSEIWAQLLVQQFASHPPNIFSGSDEKALREWIQPLQKKWHAQVPWDRLPWYAEEKARIGAFSTLLALEITPAPTGFKLWDLFRFRKGVRWRALALGDSCVFQIRGGHVEVAFPFTRSDEFNSRPFLLGSNPSRNESAWKSLRAVDGDCRPGDVFLLVTDALGQWFLREQEAGRKPWEPLLALKSPEEFNEFVACERKKTTMRNDDTTLLVCRWSDGK